MTRLFEAKPFLIAEVGSNWQTLEHCLRSIEAAKEVGADAVKFQLFDVYDLYGIDMADLDVPLFNKVEGMLKSRLPQKWLPDLKAKADACGIEFMCTAFSPELVAAVDPFVEVHKVASSDACWPQMLDAVGRTGKPCLVSVGATSFKNIERMTGHIDGDLVILYCVAAYPARTIDLRVFDLLNAEWKYVGFSDHSTDVFGAPIEAARRGAVVIEKHFTAFPNLETPDRPHSLDSFEFKTMVDHIRGLKKPEIGPTWEEDDMLVRHKRRLIATRDVSRKEALHYGVNFGAYRSLEPTGGLSPFAWERVEGKLATVAIKRGAAIGEADFE